MKSDLLEQWHNSQKLVQSGYRILDKEMTIAIPGQCFPAESSSKNLGIGSPYGNGAKRFISFWNGIIHKILLGPCGRTFPPLFSPYESGLGENPFFIPLEKWAGTLLDKSLLDEIYALPKSDQQIFYPTVSRSFHKALGQMYETFLNKQQDKDSFALDFKKQLNDFVRHNPLLQMDAQYYASFNSERYFFESFLAYEAATHNGLKIPTIGDLQVKIPPCINYKHPELFLKNFTLGAPPDFYSNANQDWFFKVFNPDFIFNKDGSLGQAGRFLYQIFDLLCKAHKGGIRIDHYIGFVNPYVISRTPKMKNGRLYSSDKHPVLKKYQKHTIDEFANITQKIILQAVYDNGMHIEDIYPEDLGTRPEQLDEVMNLCHLGRMIVTQFVNIEDDTHPYQIINTRTQDIAALDTHDTPSIIDYFSDMSDAQRYQHAISMAKNLRFQYNDALKSTENLIRMKWAELMTCPARRVQAFFTSFTGQKGRYNEPDNPKKWRLRCQTDFDRLYFQNLVAGIAFNPLDAIALAIFARGDDFYMHHQDFVAQLREQERELFAAIHQNLEK